MEATYHYIILEDFRKPLSKRCTNATFSILLDCPNAKAYSRRKRQICKHQTVYTYVGIHTVCTTICDSCTISRYDGIVLHKSRKWQIGFHSILKDAKYSSIDIVFPNSQTGDRNHPSQPERQIIVEMCNACGGLLGSWDPWVYITQLQVQGQRVILNHFPYEGL